eukprot:m51a1_g6441 putative protein serine threonine kinase (463) ;mRNA; f:378686-384856
MLTDEDFQDAHQGPDLRQRFELSNFDEVFRSFVETGLHGEAPEPGIEYRFDLGKITYEATVSLDTLRGSRGPEERMTFRLPNCGFLYPRRRELKMTKLLDEVDPPHGGHPWCVLGDREVHKLSYIIDYAHAFFHEQVFKTTLFDTHEAERHAILHELTRPSQADQAMLRSVGSIVRSLSRSRISPSKLAMPGRPVSPIRADLHVDFQVDTSLSDAETVYEGLGKDSGERVEVRVARKDAASRGRISAAPDEAQRWSRMTHPSILRLLGIYEDPAHYFLVSEAPAPDAESLMDLSESGEQHYSEADAASIVSQICSALRFMHTHGMAHKRLLPTSVMLSGPEKLTVQISECMPDLRGSTESLIVLLGQFVREAMIGEEQDDASDMWAVGCLAYLLVCDKLPFNSELLGDLYRSIKDAAFDRTGPWENLSDCAKDFISRLLVQRPDQRMTASEALLHPWIRYQS